MSDDTTKTDIIPGLRPSDTPPLGTPVPQGRHRARRGAHIPRWAQVLVFGGPVAAVALTAVLLLPGWLAGEAPHRVTASPSRPADDTTTAPPVPPLPTATPAPSHTDRLRHRTTRRPELVPPKSTPPRSTSPSPTPAPTTSQPSLPWSPPSPSLSPPRSSEPPTGSPSPTTEPPPLRIQISPTTPLQEPEHG